MIGKGGLGVKRVKQECGNVQIHFPSGDSGSDSVTVRGEPEFVKKAKEQLLEMAQNRVCLFVDLTLLFKSFLYCYNYFKMTKHTISNYYFFP